MNGFSHITHNTQPRDVVLWTRLQDVVGVVCLRGDGLMPYASTKNFIAHAYGGSDG